MRPFVSRALILTSTLLAAAALSACGGGGGGATSPSAQLPVTPNGTLPASQSTVAPGATPRPLGKAVATATLTLRLPQALIAKKASSSSRGAKYVNPLPGNFIDIYVNGPGVYSQSPSPLYNLDGVEQYCDSVSTAGAAADGTLTVNIPLYSTGVNLVAATEWSGPAYYGCNDSGSRSLLALGETNPNISPGSSNAISLTMQMNAQAIGIVDLPNLQNPFQMNNSSQTWSGATNTNVGASFLCGGVAGSYNGFALYPADAEGTLVPVAGYGGTSIATITSFQSQNGGTSRIGQSPAGGWFALLDQGNGTSCDGVIVNASVSNPAYAIYADLFNNYWSYYYGTAYNYVGGYPNQLLFTMYIGNMVPPGYYSNSSVNAGVTIGGVYPFTFATTFLQVLGTGGSPTYNDITNTNNAQDSYSIASVQNASIASAAIAADPGNGTPAVAVTGLTPGTTTVYVSDSEGQTTSFTVQVTQTNVTVQGKARQ